MYFFKKLICLNISGTLACLGACIVPESVDIQRHKYANAPWNQILAAIELWLCWTQDQYLNFSEARDLISIFGLIVFSSGGLWCKKKTQNKTRNRNLRSDTKWHFVVPALSVHTAPTNQSNSFPSTISHCFLNGLNWDHLERKPRVPVTSN